MTQSSLVRPRPSEATASAADSAYREARGGERTSALARLKALTKRGTKDDVAYAWFTLGNVLDNTEPYDFHAAVTSFNNARLLFGRWPEAWFNKAIALTHLKRYKEAIKAYDKTLECLKRAGVRDRVREGYFYGKIYLFRAEAKVGLGKRELAEEAIDEIYEAKAFFAACKDPRAQFWLGQVDGRLRSAYGALQAATPISRSPAS